MGDPWEGREEGMGKGGWARGRGCLGEGGDEGRTCPSCTLGAEEAEGRMGLRPIGGKGLSPFFKAFTCFGEFIKYYLAIIGGLLGIYSIKFNKQDIQ